jgi:acetyl esterase/lipase
LILEEDRGLRVDFLDVIWGVLNSYRGLSVATMAAILTLPRVPLMAQSGEDAGSVNVHRDIEYAAVDGQSLKLDLYIPKGVAKPMPVVIWVHGGAWREGSKRIPMVLPLVPLGFAVASIDYRLTQEAVFPAQIYDCKAAVRWVRAHAADYGFDPNHIGAVGASAGGMLVALLGTTADVPALEGNEGNLGVSSAVQVVCDFFGPTDFTNLTANYTEWQTNIVGELLGGSARENRAKARMASPVAYVNAQACPFYIVHGDKDRVVPMEQSIEFYNVLRKAGVPATLYTVKGGGHGFNDPLAFAGAASFLEQYLRGS